jgi:hypothetical protein
MRRAGSRIENNEDQIEMTEIEEFKKGSRPREVEGEMKKKL